MNVLNFSDIPDADLATLTDQERSRLEWVLWMFWFDADDARGAIQYMRELGESAPSDPMVGA